MVEVGGALRVQRSWSVALLDGKVRCQVPGCDEPLPHGRVARSATLAHLAWHARSETLPAHVRICCCRAGGCSWHPKRHRLCDGPITLALFPRHAGRIWHLADACTGCRSAIPQAARVPEAPAAHPQPKRREEGGSGDWLVRRARGKRRGSATVRLDRAAVTTALSYLAAVLAGTSPQARLLALAFTLQADPSGYAVLPAGLRRGLRLEIAARDLAELTQARWMRLVSGSDGGRMPKNAPLVVVISDFIVTGPPIPACRADRAAARHWCWSMLTHRQVRQASPQARLAALVVAASSDPVTGETVLDASVLARLCALPHDGDLPPLLDMLANMGWIRSWHHRGNGLLHTAAGTIDTTAPAHAKEHSLPSAAVR